MKKFAILFLGMLLVACQGMKSIKSVFNRVSPYDQYLESLKKAGLLNASMAKEWIAAGQRVFHDSVMVQAPFSESGYFPAGTAEARSYRFKVQEGQVLTVHGVVKTERNARIFLDLFVRDGGDWEELTHADSTFSITREFTSDQECVLRLQPELLANVYYAVSVSISPVLINPVYGASNRSIGSFYGAARDEGKRLHEGVDIFAKKGTPILAPTDGYITRVGRNRLGGKVIWMEDSKRNCSYYFAHLDSQMVQTGMRVFQGYVLGLVGKTGNARNTAPHLHFGIYDSGSKDPLYYIQQGKAFRDTLAIDTGFHHQPCKTGRKGIKMMTGPSRALPLRTSLQKDTYVTVIGQSQDWYRISLPDNSQGYVLKRNVIPLQGGTVVQLDSSRLLLSRISKDAIPIATLREDTSVEILAHFEDYQFVRTQKGKAGWLYN